MNIRIKADKVRHLDKICKEMKMNPSQLIEFFMDIIQHLYSDYERNKEAGVEKSSFEEILAKLFFHSFMSKLRTLNTTENLIEYTNGLLGIDVYGGAVIHDINPDFERRSISYSIGYDFCMDAANMYAYKALVIEVEINQDYIQVSHEVCEPTFESEEITVKRLNDTSNRVQEFFKALYHEEFSPFANIEIKLLPVRENPCSPEPCQYVVIKLIVKADNANHIPSLEKIRPIAGRVHSIVMEELNLKK